jgi:hypothetical protein
VAVPHAFELTGSYARAPRHAVPGTDFSSCAGSSREGIFYFRQTQDADVEQLVLSDDGLYRFRPARPLAMRSGRF